jgi:hypothetical protein
MNTLPTLKQSSETRPAPGQITLLLLSASDPLATLAEHRTPRADSRGPAAVGFLNLCGLVLSVGAEVSHVQVDDIVYGTAASWLSGTGAALATSPGATATHDGWEAPVVAVDARYVALRPDSLTAIEAAALPSCGAMALKALTGAELAVGDRLLVMDAASPVGSLAVQIGEAMGAHVTASCRDKEVPLVLDLGADTVIATDRSDSRSLGFWLRDPTDPTLLDMIPQFDVVIAPNPLDLRGLMLGGSGYQPRLAAVEPAALVEREVLDKLRRLADEHGCAPHVPTVYPPASFPACFIDRRGPRGGLVVVSFNRDAF